MKKLIIFILFFCNIIVAKTINIDKWEPQYKYKSLETYTNSYAHNYCDNKKQCMIKREPGGYRVYTNIINCPPILMGNMDSYIGSSLSIDVFIDRCSDSNIYEAIKVGKYSDRNTNFQTTYGIPVTITLYIWKIKKKNEMKFEKLK